MIQDQWFENQTISIFSETWFGLSDRQFEGYYLWSDDTSFDDSAPPYMPTIISEDHDCFVLVDDQTWTTDDCHSTRQYLCQYPVQNGMFCYFKANSIIKPNRLICEKGPYSDKVM